jgi:hypothetical protein
MAALLPALLLLGACQSASKQEADADAEALRWQFREQVLLATQAINNGDLNQAKKHVRSAKGKAFSRSQQRKIQSLESLIAGAEALREGDGSMAAAEWSQIQDPSLQAEVRKKARRIGVDVPENPVNEKEEQ